MWLLQGVHLGLAPEVLVPCPWEKVEKQKTGPGVSCPIKLQRLWYGAALGACIQDYVSAPWAARDGASLIGAWSGEVLSLHHAAGA